MPSPVLSSWHEWAVWRGTAAVRGHRAMNDIARHRGERMLLLVLLCQLCITRQSLVQLELQVELSRRRNDADLHERLVLGQRVDEGLHSLPCEVVATDAERRERRIGAECSSEETRSSVPQVVSCTAKSTQRRIGGQGISDRLDTIQADGVVRDVDFAQPTRVARNQLRNVHGSCGADSRVLRNQASEPMIVNIERERERETCERTDIDSLARVLLSRRISMSACAPSVPIGLP